MHKNNNIKAKESKLKTQKVTFKQSFMGKCTNIIFKLGVIGGIKSSVPQIFRTSSASKSIVLLGQQFTDKTTAKQRLGKIIWFTYRQKLKITQDLNSDVGWGCLPRVGQMVLAQAITRHFKFKGQNLNEQLQRRIIEHFIDDDENQSSYSLSTILKYARWRCAINPGDWFNIGQLSQVLRKIQDQVPLEGSQGLKIIFFNQSVIFLNQIQQKTSINPCQCAQKQVFCQQCNKNYNPFRSSNQKQKIQTKDNESVEFIVTVQQYKGEENKVQQVSNQSKKEEMAKVQNNQVKQWQIYDETNIKQLMGQNQQKQALNGQNQAQKQQNNNSSQLQSHLLLIVSVRLGQKNIQKFDFQSVISLLRMPTSLGIIGGVPNKALYIVGFQDNQLIYLDPHYVQQYVDRHNYIDHINTFFCTEYRTISMQFLDPSMAFCFYIRTKEDLRDLLLKIQKLRQIYKKNNRCFFLSVMQSNIYDQQQDESVKTNSKQNSRNTVQKSCQYSSLEFQNISDSL